MQPAIQLIPDYTPIYTNHKVIEKPPVKTAKESLVSALDSFYNDIARIENIGIEKVPQRQDTTTVEPSSLPTEEAKLETDQEPTPVETTVKEKKRKRVKYLNKRSKINLIYIDYKEITLCYDFRQGLVLVKSIKKSLVWLQNGKRCNRISKIRKLVS